MQQSQNDYRAGVVRFNAINDQIGQTGNHEFPRVGRTARLATERELRKLLDRRQYAPTDRRGNGGIMGSDSFNSPQEIIVCRLGPSDRHGRGETIRSKAATTI